MPHFLSSEWMDATKSIREQHSAELPTISTSIRMNQVITDVPETVAPEGTVNTYVDTSSGQLVMEFGELDEPDLTMTTDYETARKILVEQDQAAGMQAFMAGKIKIQGDMMKMMALQTSMPQNDTTRQIAEEIKAITTAPEPPSE